MNLTEIQIEGIKWSIVELSKQIYMYEDALQKQPTNLSLQQQLDKYKALHEGLNQLIR